MIFCALLESSSPDADIDVRYTKGKGGAMADMGYTDTFIQVATDCPATAGVVPVAR